jgi:hypothetical protein
MIVGERVFSCQKPAVVSLRVGFLDLSAMQTNDGGVS